MFRIVFDTQAGMWVIQFAKWELFWMTVQDEDAPKFFPNLQEARQYVTDKGIDQIYIEQKAAARYMPSFSSN